MHEHSFTLEILPYSNLSASHAFISVEEPIDKRKEYESQFMRSVDQKYEILEIQLFRN